MVWVEISIAGCVLVIRPSNWITLDDSAFAEEDEMDYNTMG